MKAAFADVQATLIEDLFFMVAQEIIHMIPLEVSLEQAERFSEEELDEFGPPLQAEAELTELEDEDDLPPVTPSARSRVKVSGR